jgi:uncharacterized protein with ParB-like and HNH nuclease domain
VPGEYEKAISIKDAIDAINHRNFLLPAIQRKFVWSSHQICVLFDSIMRGYPINSFMTWEVNKDEIKNSYKFYAFLDFYCQRFHEENPLVPTAGFENFKAIIDGQQRLTSLYIGLCGTYAYKQPRVWWPTANNHEILPPRKLYLDLIKPLNSDEEETMMKYNFKFLTDKQYKAHCNDPHNLHHWFCLHEILEMAQVDGSNHVWNRVVRPYLVKNELEANEYAQETLGQLYDVIRSQRIIHYFNETSQEIDHVLDVFIRTNSGGTKLDFSDLLMSIAVAHWDGDFRQELDGLIKNIHQDSTMGFYMERDWILKTCLVLIGADVRFKVKNFSSEQVKQIQDSWENIKESIKNTLFLIRRFGINPQSLTSKNAVIPICYYLYKKKKNINDLAKHHEDRELISRWFYMALLKGVFGGQADSILKSMRDLLDKHIEEDLFPLQSIIDRFTATNKDLRFDVQYIESLLNIEHGEGRCRALLHLLFPEMNSTEVFHIDHLHPRSQFDKNKLNKIDFLVDSTDMFNFYLNPKHWNSIANLHLLNDSQNLSKKDKSLTDWLNDPNIHLTAESLLVNKDVLGFDSFPEFYAQRRESLKQRLIQRVFMTSTSTESVLINDKDDEDDEEVVDDIR